MNGMFLTGDQKRADEEIKCYEHCKNLSSEYFDKGYFDEAIGYLDNAQRSLLELKRMRKSKLEHDKAMFILGQIKSTKDQHELLGRLKANAR